MSWDRVILLGEDIAHRQFLRGVCASRKWTVVDEAFSPRGLGAASGWVIREFPRRLGAARSYPGLGLLVALDGDNRGRADRLNALRRSCVELGAVPVNPQDRAAVLVPTWSIDTWALFFFKDLVIPEDTRSKPRSKALYFQPAGFTSPGTPIDDAPRLFKPKPLGALVSGFLSDRGHPEIPSLDSSRQDLREAAFRP